MKRFFNIQLAKNLVPTIADDAEVLLVAVNKYQGTTTTINSGMDGAVRVNNTNYSKYRVAVTFGTTVSASVDYTASRVNFTGWFYDNQGRVPYSSSESISFTAIDGGVTLYAIFESDTIDEEWCYHPTSKSYLCNVCDKETVFFDKSNLLDSGYAKVLWYSNLALSSYASPGYYTSSNKFATTPIYLVDSVGRATVVDYCDGDQISCGDDPANDGYGGESSQLVLTKITESGANSFWTWSGGTPNGNVTISVTTTYSGNWSGSNDAACLETILSYPSSSITDTDSDSLNTVQQFATFFTLAATLNVPSNSSGNGSFKIYNYANNWDSASSNTEIGNYCGVDVTDQSSGNTATGNNTGIQAVSSGTNCTNNQNP